MDLQYFTWPTKNEILHLKSLPTCDLNLSIEQIADIADNMIKVMHKHKGIGLAAPQVGIGARIIVIDTKEEGVEMPLIMVDPLITIYSKEKSLYKEGCLSIPKIYASVERPDTITVSYQDRNYQERYETFTGLTARCIQHEIDHLEGILFIDHLSKFNKTRALQKYLK